MISKLVIPMLPGVGLLLTLLSGCAADSVPNVPQSEVSSTPVVVREKASSDKVPSDSNRLKPDSKSQLLKAYPRFTEIAEQVGVQFTYTNGSSGKVLMVEATGGGAGWLDYDGDGRLDLYLCQGGDPAAETRDGQPLDQLFRQSDDGRFERVTIAAGIIEQFYSQGVAVADFDDDGFDDVFITNVGPDTLLWNRGDGTYEDISNQSGVADVLWGSSAAWSDLDGDGNLDLYVCNYVDYDPYHPIPCGSEERPGTCHPMHVKAVPDSCYISRGDGTFSEEAKSRGLFGPDNKALGLVIADLNNDGRPDVYIANDTTPNFLFVNQGQGKFAESANVLGCAVNRDGLPQASMGVALGDFDHNGWLDLYCTHFTKESNTLYKNLGETGFQDVTGIVGLHAPTLKYLGFGAVMTDFNQDGHEDIFVANGHVDDWRHKGDEYEMPHQMFSYEGPRFIECSAEAGDFFSHRVIGRAAAAGDFDNDGDWDLAVVHQNSPTAILRNDSTRGHWLKLRCQAKGNRRGWGTRIILRQQSRVLTQELAGGSSYCASHERALIFGLGESEAPVDLEIRWPDGSSQRLESVAIDQELTIRQRPQSKESHNEPAPTGTT